MDKKYRQALTEVLEVLNHTDKELIARIPEDFAIFLLKNRDSSYNPNIDFSNDNWELVLREETKAILAYIYKEYMLTDQEKINLLSDEALVKKGEEMLQKYGVEDLFVNNNSPIMASSTPAEMKIQPWYKKVFKSIINLFKK